MYVWLLGSSGAVRHSTVNPSAFTFTAKEPENYESSCIAWLEDPAIIRNVGSYLTMGMA
jgi:hypothetical protein